MAGWRTENYKFVWVGWYLWTFLKWDFQGVLRWNDYYRLVCVCVSTATLHAVLSLSIESIQSANYCYYVIRSSDVWKKVEFFLLWKFSENRRLRHHSVFIYGSVDLRSAQHESDPCARIKEFSFYFIHAISVTNAYICVYIQIPLCIYIISYLHNSFTCAYF